MSQVRGMDAMVLFGALDSMGIRAMGHWDPRNPISGQPRNGAKERCPGNLITIIDNILVITSTIAPIQAVTKCKNPWNGNY